MRSNTSCRNFNEVDKSWLQKVHHIHLLLTLVVEVGNEAAGVVEDADPNPKSRVSLADCPSPQEPALRSPRPSAGGFAAWGSGDAPGRESETF